MREHKNVLLVLFVLFLGCSPILGLEPTQKDPQIEPAIYPDDHPLPSSESIVVSTSVELADALAHVNVAGKTIYMNAGVYESPKYGFSVDFDSVVIKANTLDSVRPIVEVMNNHAGGVACFQVKGNHVVIDGLRIWGGDHGIMVKGEVGGDFFTVRRCAFYDQNDQMLKVTFRDNQNGYCEQGLVEKCLFEQLSGQGPDSYMGGVDAHRAKDWVVDGCVFRYIQSPGPEPSEAAVHFWSNSVDTVVKNCRFFNCDRGITFGLRGRGHIGGQILNNQFSHTFYPPEQSPEADVSIELEDATGVLVENNTVCQLSDFGWAISYRFDTSGTIIRNNTVFCNAPPANRIKSRNGGTALVENNTFPNTCNPY